VGPLAAALLAAPAPAQEAPPMPKPEERFVPEVRAVRAATPIVLDGRLDDPAWTWAPAFDAFRQLDPDEGQPATERTELRVAYDEQSIYVGVRLYDGEPALISRRLSRRDYASDADRVRILLDPYHDHLTGALFEVTAAGVQGDAAIYNDTFEDPAWDAVWESAVSEDAEGWSVELRIPFAQLRFPAALDEHTWGINAERVIQRKNEHDWLELVPKTESGLASRMAHLTGLESIRASKALSLLPYAAARSEHVAPFDGDPFNDGSRQFKGLGLDLKYGLSSNLTIDATLNPDFGQVEVDPAVVNLTQFETFYEEKRPFFLEGAQILENFGRNGASRFFSFDRAEPTIFYSRRIGRSPQGFPDADYADVPSATTILGAGKLTGKTASGWSVALLEAVTGREWARTESASVFGREQVEPLSNHLAGRLHRDFAGGGLGFLVTSVARDVDLSVPTLSSLLPRRAIVAGVDGYGFVDARKEWVVHGRFALSRLDGEAAAIEGIQRDPTHNFQRPDAGQDRLDPDASSLSGWTGSLNLNRNAGKLQLNAALWGVSPGFDSNDLGFNTRSDRWGAHVVGTLRKTTPDGFTRSRSLSLAKWYTLNFDNERQADGLQASFSGELRNFWFVGGGAFYRRRVGNDQLTRGGPSMITGASRGVNVFLQSDVRYNVTYGFDSSYSSNEYGGWSFDFSPSVSLKPASWLTLSLGPSLFRRKTIAQYVTTVADPEAQATFGGRYVFAGLEQTELAMTARVNWILTPRISLQLFAQPLVSAADYDGFKELARPKSFDFLAYGVDAGRLTFDADEELYRVDPDGDGPAEAFAFEQPDFNFRSLRVNAVFRWEWRPGSALYCVWTQDRADFVTLGEFDFGRDTSAMFGAPTDDVFLVKLSYHFGR
jgi:hypothetical protein